MNNRILTMLICSLLIIGCSSYSVTREHEILRKRVLKLHENQIWANLIAYKYGGTPMHLDYSDFDGQGSAEVGLKHHYGDDDTFDPSFASDRDRTALLEIDNDGYTVDGNVKSNTTMKVKAQPAVGPKAKNIFTAYEKFPSRFLRGPYAKLPSDERAYFISHHIKSGRHRGYYYIINTKEARLKWREMVIATTWANHTLVKAPTKPTKVENVVKTITKTTTTTADGSKTEKVETEEQNKTKVP